MAASVNTCAHLVVGTVHSMTQVMTTDKQLELFTYSSLVLCQHTDSMYETLLSLVERQTISLCHELPWKQYNFLEQ